MAGFADYGKYDALGLADLVAGRDVTPEELLDEAIARTERVNPKINAVVLKHYDLARKTIADGLPDGPFRGVPFLLKDLHLLLNGTVTSFGSNLFRDNLADHDSTLTARYKAAGLVIFGKTNSPEFGLAGTTEPRAYGATRNPWNLDRSAGGSSGGAAAAVAAGILPVANASDGGGSIRIPASACGLFGFKPTRARTPMGPDRGEGWGGQSISHCVSWTVRDSAALLDATEGPEPGDPYAAPTRYAPYRADAERDPAALRIAINWKRPDGSDPTPDAIAAVKNAGKLLESLGHNVKEAAPVLDPAIMSNHQATLIGANIALTVEMRERALGRSAGEEDLETITRLIAGAAKGRTSIAYAEAVLFIHQLGRHLAKFHERYDVYVCPTLDGPAIELGKLSMMSENVGAYIDLNRRYLPYTAVFNMTGQPSMSVPLHQAADGMPVGVMFTAPFGDDATLFRLAGQLERAAPWIERKPALYA